jgi:hypothetical protein
MLEPHFDRLRSEVGDAVRQPDFSTVRRRAGQVRRRRIVTSAAVFLTTVLTATGLGYATQRGPDPAPATTVAPDDASHSMISATSTGKDLYSVRAPCQACDLELFASADGGATWQPRTTPSAPADPAAPRIVTLIALAPRTVVWRDHRVVTIDEADEALDSGTPTGGQSPAAPAPPDQLWITVDGGATWRRTATGTRPVTSAPAGVKPVDCELQQISTCSVAAIDPATGRFAPLKAQPTGITVDPLWASRINVPLDGRLWVPGLDPATDKPAVATSSDAGRTWHTHVFTSAVAARPDPDRTAGKYLPQVAAGSGGTAYVLTYRADNVVDVQYTSDGGLTWRAGATIHDAGPGAGFVTADGSHIVTADNGLVAGRGTGRYAPVTLPGYPNDRIQAPQVASRKTTERYLVTSESGLHLSADGRTWRRARLP